VSQDGATWSETSHAVQPASSARPFLFVVLECERPTSRGARYVLTDLAEVVVGRADERGAIRENAGFGWRLKIGIPGRFMSSTHARIVRDENRWTLHDEGSKNGSHVNGRRVSEHVLEDGDILELGRTLFLFRDDLNVRPELARDEDASKGDDRALLTLSPELAQRYHALAEVARSQVSILLEGDTGTGKEVVARAIHELSGRTGPFVAVNLGGLGSLVEGQLFGHVRGAFTSAIRDEQGYVRAAHEGTLFLDELGDLPPAAQASLLRVLQEREVVPVGSTRSVKVDVRVVSATHRPLDRMCENGAFRKDLLGRLAGFRQTLPKLSDRREDLGTIIAHILLKIAPDRAARMRIQTEVGRAFLAYAWPLNIRELEQCLSVAVVRATNDLISLEHLEGTMTTSSGSSDQELRRTLIALLQKHHGNVSEVSRVMGKHRMQIQRWMKRLGIDREKLEDCNTVLQHVAGECPDEEPKLQGARRGTHPKTKP
jgi:transcriptional regulator with AAA-type ATPase domain